MCRNNHAYFWHAKPTFLNLQVSAYLTVPKSQLLLAVLRKGLDAKIQPAYFGDTFWPSFQYICWHVWHMPGPSPRSKLRRFPHLHIQPVILPGLPTTRAKSGTSFTTTAPAPIKAYCPIVTPQTIVQLAPRVAPRCTNVGRSSSMRRIALRGLNTFVNTIDGPQNTSSSRVTPSYTETLFWIFTPSPILTCGSMTTFWPIRQFFPICEWCNTWDTCQMVVPSPISTSSS